MHLPLHSAVVEQQLDVFHDIANVYGANYVLGLFQALDSGTNKTEKVPVLKGSHIGEFGDTPGTGKCRKDDKWMSGCKEIEGGDCTTCQSSVHREKNSLRERAIWTCGFPGYIN